MAEQVFRAKVNDEYQYFESREEADMAERGPKILAALQARKVFTADEINSIMAMGKGILDAFQVQGTKKHHRAKLAKILTAVVADEEFCKKGELDRAFLMKAKEDVETTWKFTKARPPAEALAELEFDEELVKKLVTLRTEVQEDLKAGIEKRALPENLIKYREEQRKLKEAAAGGAVEGEDEDPAALVGEDDDDLDS